MNPAEATSETTNPRGPLRIPTSAKMAASPSTSSVAGIHGGNTSIPGGNYYDLTADDNHLPGAHGRRRCCHGGAVMDDGRDYSGTPASMVMTKVKNKRPEPKQRGISVIQSADGSDESDGEDDNGASKKRSLQRNDRCKSGGSTEKSSPMIRKRTRRPSNNDSQSQLPTCHLNLPSSRTQDGATITFGLLSLIDLLKDPKNTLTCEGNLASSNRKLFKPITPSSMSTTLPFNHQPFHYLQNDNWGCGFRNLQMLISSMMPALNSIFPEGVPSVEDIQRTMEILWSEGFDRSNAEHHKRSLTGKKTWIGTVEVWSYLSFKRVDSMIVQFIKTEENRAMIGKFVWAYFSRIGAFGCPCDHYDSAAGSSLATSSMSSSMYAAHLLKEISKPKSDDVANFQGMGRMCKCSLPPLYLQWNGHSVTIVGVKRINNTTGNLPSFNLVIFCPQKNGSYIKGILAREFNIRHNTDERPREQEQSEKFVNSVIELPVTKLQGKDCQILLSTARIIDQAESNHRKSCTNNIGFLNADASTK
mmetsp:Transcript_13413/g.29131  ORF Transcript_13413/g.29131 Transcript_13413/m.29131 type:complete len:530 (+) Transcript_13413:81-1670(+)|eukprot:CAMPEP_0172314090 /NCGR_PEP_ID=MMETSP1058-20130122/21631_1 /TAXON_ID=83371 /ORGANISM="Detonula confervacea, Strain CCMP 353" /LENGTH=529 /DNA_ID=CAMNT_0013027855 /DNA_START=41 /DNA_END=1630 /DNA_ORIENTATION=-